MLQVIRSARSWRTPLVVLVTAATAAVAFVYRFNTPEGSLGGFPNDHFAHLMRVEMLLHGEQPVRDFDDAELRGVWPALSYLLPAWAQQVGGRSLLPEAWLTLGTIAVAHALLVPLVLALSGRWSVALLATLVAIMTAPRAYSYPKVLALALGVLALRFVMGHPSTPRLAAAALVTAIATLFRHDCGVYVAAGVIAGLVARDPSLRMALRRVGVYAGLSALLLLPGAVWVQWYQGIPAYLAASLATAAREAGRTRLEVPPFWAISPATGEGQVALAYYACWMVLAVAAGVLMWRRTSGVPAAPSDRATAVGLLATSALAIHFLLRGTLGERIGDAMIPVLALAAWTTGAARGIRSPAARRVATAVPVALLVVLLASVSAYADAARQLDSSGVLRGWSAAAERFSAMADQLRTLPPVDWSLVDEDAGLPDAARYVAECTAPDDYLLMAAEAPEIPVFARRRFAAGQAMLAIGLYTAEADQRRALARLTGQSVPIILADAARYHSEFVFTYPFVARHIAGRYREAGTLDGRFLVLVESDRRVHRIDPPTGLPCFAGAPVRAPRSTA